MMVSCWPGGMRDNDGRQLGHDTLEEMRKRAVEQMEHRGVRPEQIADALGLDRSTVYGWRAAYRQHGTEALQARPIPGRPHKLGQAELDQLDELVRTDPRTLGFTQALWTRAMVGKLITTEFGVRLSLPTVGRVLHRLGMSPQRPLHAACEQDPEAVRHWKDQEYPQLAEQARVEGATLFFVDEAGIRSDYHAGTTWAPVGQTPVVETTGQRFSINMISAFTPKGALRFAVYDHTTTAECFIDFCRRLLSDIAGPVYLVVDGHPAHRARRTSEFIATTEGRLQLVFLPGYAPELNPDEWVNKHTKHDDLGRTEVSSRAELKRTARVSLHRLQKLPETIRGFFADPHLHYITA